MAPNETVVSCGPKPTAERSAARRHAEPLGNSLRRRWRSELTDSLRNRYDVVKRHLRQPCPSGRSLSFLYLFVCHNTLYIPCSTGYLSDRPSISQQFADSRGVDNAGSSHTLSRALASGHDSF